MNFLISVKNNKTLKNDFKHLFCIIITLVFSLHYYIKNNYILLDINKNRYKFLKKYLLNRKYEKKITFVLNLILN